MSLLSTLSSVQAKADKGASNPDEGEERTMDEAARTLTLLAEGAALAVPEIDTEACRDFRGKVRALAARLPDRLPEEEKLALVRSLVNEFDVYRKSAETELRNRAKEWRAVVELLLLDLLRSLGIQEGITNASQLLKRIAGVNSADEVGRLHDAIDLFLHPQGAGSAPVEASQFRTANHSTENDNAAGLRGGGSAIAHLEHIMEQGGRGYIVLFRLSCLNMIHQRFGDETVQDCLMAVAAFLTQSLHSDDQTYHWSDSSLLSILQGRVNEQILTAELERIVLKNRETCVNIGGRATMLRIPITFDITPIDQLQTAEDLLKINLLCHSGGSR
jgi:GGDEF domain-containing protein